MKDREVIHYLKEKMGAKECFVYISRETIFEEEIENYKLDLCGVDLVSDYEFIRIKDKYIIKVYTHVEIDDLLEEIELEFRRELC